MRQVQWGAMTVMLLGMAIGQAQAQFTETFDLGSATYTVNDPYWTNQALANGYIIKSTNSPSVFGGLFGNDINQDLSGKGYFLFEGTASSNGTSNSTIPTGHDEFYISPSFTVTPNTNYAISFYLTNADTINSIASIQPEIGASLLGSPVSAAGFFTDGNPAHQWQQFLYSWNSGTNTSASLILHDFTTATSGNDFGVDGISVRTNVPEPGSVALLGGALVVGGLALRRRQK